MHGDGRIPWIHTDDGRAPEAATTAGRRRRPVSAAAEIVLESFDIIFAAIISSLDLDDLQVDVPGVLYAVDLTRGYVEGAPRFQGKNTIIQSDQRRPREYHPVLASVLMTLKAQAPPRMYHYALDLVITGVFQDHEVAPGSVVGDEIRSGRAVAHIRGIGVHP